MDPLLHEKLNISQLFDAGNGADRTDGPTMHLESEVNEIGLRTEIVWTRNSYPIEWGLGTHLRRGHSPWGKVTVKEFVLVTLTPTL